MQAIHQFLAGFTVGDAISNESVVLQTIFASWGMEANIFCETFRTLARLRDMVKDVKTACSIVKPDDIAILHLSIGSDVNDIFAGLRCRKAIIYHNITPPHYFGFFNPNVASLLARGIEQTKEMSTLQAICMADSRYNAEELEKYGYKNVQVLPLILNFDLWKNINTRYMKKLKDGMVNVIFVGRIVPNKKIEDVILAFHYFQKWVKPNSRLILAGSYAGMERYFYYLQAGIKKLGTENVIFTGMIPQDQLNACYAASSVFLCMSEHEGFCIPLLESMFHSVPVMAYSAAAVPETLDDSGIIFTRKDFSRIAEMIGILYDDANLHNVIVKSQTARLQKFKERNIESELRMFLSPLMQ